jgi:Ras GTPase-activating-like protein IQGAP2/3
LGVTVTDVEEPESYFGVDALTDQTSTHKPIVFISPSELFHLHYTIQNNLDSIEPEGSGILHDIINEIGPSIYRPDIELPESMVCLTLTNRHDDIPMDPGARLQQLLVETKRLVSYVIKIQSGPNLDHILRESINQEYEIEWGHFKSREFSSNTHIDHTIATKRRHLKLGQTDTPIDLQR